MSVSSVGSVSVMFRGEEKDIEDVLRGAIKEVQGFLNDVEMSLINLSAQVDQDCEFQPMYTESLKITDGIDGLVAVMKDLKPIAKQLLPACKGDDKKWKSDLDSKRKNEKEMEKARVALEKQSLADVKE